MKSLFVLFFVAFVVAIVSAQQQTTNQLTVNINAPQPQPFGMFTVEFTFQNKVKVSDTNLMLRASNSKGIDFISTRDVQRPFESSVGVTGEYGNNCSPCYYADADEKIASLCVQTGTDSTTFRLTPFVDIEAEQTVHCALRHGAYIVADEKDAVELNFEVNSESYDSVKYQLTTDSNVIYSTLQNIDETTPKFINTKFTRRVGPIYGGLYPGPLSVLEFTVSNIPSGAFYGVDIGELQWGNETLGQRSLLRMVEPEFMVSTEWKCSTDSNDDSTARLHFTPQEYQEIPSQQRVSAFSIATTKDHNPLTLITCQIPIPLQEIATEALGLFLNGDDDDMPDMTRFEKALTSSTKLKAELRIGFNEVKLSNGSKAKRLAVSQLVDLAPISGSITMPQGGSSFQLDHTLAMSTAALITSSSSVRMKITDVSGALNKKLWQDNTYVLLGDYTSVMEWVQSLAPEDGGDYDDGDYAMKVVSTNPKATSSQQLDTLMKRINNKMKKTTTMKKKNIKKQQQKIQQDYDGDYADDFGMADLFPSMFKSKEFNTFKEQASKQGISIVTMPGKDTITFPKQGLLVAVFFTDLRRAVPSTSMDIRLPYCIHMNVNNIDSTMCDDDLPTLAMSIPGSTNNKLTQIVSLSQTEITVQVGLKFSYDHDDTDSDKTGDLAVKLNHFIVPNMYPVDLRATAQPTSCNIIPYNEVSPTTPTPTNWKFNVEFKTRQVNETIVDPFTTGYLHITGEAPAPSDALLTCTWPILPGPKADPTNPSNGFELPSVSFRLYQPNDARYSSSYDWSTGFYIPLKDAKKIDKTNWNTFTEQTCTYALVVTPPQPLTSSTQLAALKQTVVNILNTNFAIYDEADGTIEQQPFGELTVDDLLLPSGPGYDYPQDYSPRFARFSSLDALMTPSRRLGDTSEELQQPYASTVVFLLDANKAPRNYPVEHQTRRGSDGTLVTPVDVNQNLGCANFNPFEPFDAQTSTPSHYQFQPIGAPCRSSNQCVGFNDYSEPTACVLNRCVSLYDVAQNPAQMMMFYSIERNLEITDSVTPDALFSEGAYHPTYSSTEGSNSASTTSVAYSLMYVIVIIGTIVTLFY